MKKKKKSKKLAHKSTIFKPWCLKLANKHEGSNWKYDIAYAYVCVHICIYKLDARSHPHIAK